MTYVKNTTKMQFFAKQSISIENFNKHLKHISCPNNCECVLNAFSFLSQYISS